jgi:L-seryl-tRNA(Ser) seleniumtransferase
MMQMTVTATNDNSMGDFYRMLPSLGDLLLTPPFAVMLQSHSHTAVVNAVRIVLRQLKDEIAACQHTQISLSQRVSCLDASVAAELALSSSYSLKRVINATGVVLHTNLGRSPLSQAALDHICEVAKGYSNLELDLESGERSRRDVHAENLLLRLLELSGGMRTGSLVRRAIVVNNCAAATFLTLNSIAEGAEVVVSRGELVEIGGGFRIPEILAKSGARLREVGTTNRTRLSDYESAMTPDTGLVLRVHQSNFSIEGFTERPTLSDLVTLCKERGVPFFDDQGTGVIASLSDLGIRDEPTLVESFCAGSDLIAASGDKLLGGPQCGLLIGRADLIERIRKNPLFRAFRVDKLTYAALEATLLAYLLGRENSIPNRNMLHVSAAELARRCEQVVCEIDSAAELVAEALQVESLIGGGTAPSARLPSWAISLRHAAWPPQSLLSALRRLDPPIVARISEERVLLDFRTIEPEFDVLLPRLLIQATQKSATALMQKSLEIA